MDLTARQLGRRELARRLFIERARSGLLLECPLVPFERAGLAFHAPACLDALRAERAAWSQAADLRESPRAADRRNAQIVHLPDLAEPTAALARVPDLAVRRHSELDWDALIPPCASQTAGHFSYAHKRRRIIDPFTDGYDPLSNHSASWSALQDGGYVKSESGLAVLKAPGSAERQSFYRFEAYTPPSPDHSVEADVVCSYTSGTRREWGLIARMTDLNNLYLLTIWAGGNEFGLYKRVAGAWTAVGSWTTTDFDATIRLELVGSTLKGYHAGIERIVASDSSLSAAGHAGFRGFQSVGAVGTATMDNFAVYTDGPGRVSVPVGPLAALALPRFALAC